MSMTASRNHPNRSFQGRGESRSNERRVRDIGSSEAGVIRQGFGVAHKNPPHQVSGRNERSTLSCQAGAA
jgi:hypothetical protein